MEGTLKAETFGDGDFVAQYIVGPRMKVIVVVLVLVVAVVVEVVVAVAVVVVVVFYLKVS